MTRLAEMIRGYEQDLLDKIYNLEMKVSELTSTNEKLKTTGEKKHGGMIDLLLGKVEAPVGLTFDNRDFLTDLRTLIAHTMDRRDKGHKSNDEEGRRIPFVPVSGQLHMWLDKEAGFPKMTASDMKLYCDNREQWIQALLTEFHKVM
jgi:hypothetical protein